MIYLTSEKRLYEIELNAKQKERKKNRKKTKNKKKEKKKEKKRKKKMGIAGRPPRGIPGNSKSSGLIEIIKKTLKT